MAVLTAIALLLRITRLGSQSFWIDEVLSYGWIDEIRTHGFAPLLHNIHGPLHAVALWAVSHVSTNEWWLRLPSAIAGTLVVPILALFGRALWGRSAGIVAAALATFSPFALYYSQECRGYSFSILFATLIGWAALHFVRRPGPKGALALGAAELAGVASNLNAVFAILGLGIWGLVTCRARPRALAGWIALHVVVALLLVPYAYQITHQVRPERLVGVETGFGEKEALRGATTLHPMALPYTAYAFAAGFSLGPTLEELRSDPRASARPRHLPVLAIVVFGFGVPLLVGLRRGMRDLGGSMLVASAVSTLAFTIWLAAANMKPYNVRYLSVVFPAFILFTALGVVRLPRRWGMVCFAAALAAGAVGCFNYLFVPRYGRDDVRGAVHYVAEHAAPEDAIVQISLTACMRHYYTALGKRPVHPPAVATASPDSARAWLAETAGTAPVIWYLECRPETIDSAGTFRKAVTGMARSEGVTPFTGIRVHRYQMAP